MSIKSAATAFAIALLLGSTAQVRAQETDAPLDTAHIPSRAGAFAPGDTELRHSAATATFGMPAQAGGTLDLCENAWDFSKPDTIPGFGSLPPNYARSLLPRFSGEPFEGTVAGGPQ
jgi:hypothetical protein